MEINEKTNLEYLTEMKLSDNDVGNKKVNAADLKDHETIVAIFKKDDKILVEDHVKYDFLIPPSGKADPGEKMFEALRREVWEETDLQIDKAHRLFSAAHYFIRGEKGDEHKVKVTFHFFEVDKYHGTLKNKEPQKHRDIFWKSINEIRKIKGRVSHAIYYYLKYLDGEVEDIDDYKEY